MNKKIQLHKDIDTRLGWLEIEEKIRASLDKFVFDCLHSDYDVIVPIQEEGLAIMLPQLRKQRELKPEIIPSNSLDHLDPDKLKGKSVLLVEAAVRSGGELNYVSNKIERNFRVKNTAFACYLVLEEFPYVDDLVIPGFFILTANQYLWAKDVIVEYLLNEVFVHFADPPLWEYVLDQEMSQRLLSLLLQFGHSYIVPEPGESDWIRLSLDGIDIQDVGWLHETIEVQQPIKIRVSIHKSNGRVQILPLFYPKVPDETSLPVSKLMECARFAFPTQFNRIIQLSEEVSTSSYNSFRWISAIGSILLLRDLIHIIDSMDLHLDNIKLSAPIPNLYQYSCSETILSAFEELTRAILKSVPQKGQYTLPKMCFHFRIEEKVDPDSLLLDAPFENNSPQEGLVYALGRWIKSFNSEAPNTNQTIEKSISIEGLHDFFPYMTKEAMSRGLDMLIDEGVVKPRLGRDKKNRVVRTYAPGSESIRMHLLALGMATNFVLKRDG